MKSKIRYKILEIIDDNLRKEYLNAINNVYKHGRFILDEIDELEENLSEIKKKTLYYSIQWNNVIDN